MSEPVILCEFCNTPVDPSAPGTFRRVIGWVKNRTQGGGNAIAMASDPTGWAHPDCIDITKRRGEIAWREDSLF